ncbi:MAG: GNAT family protein [Pseudomonadota bacterium]
MQLLPVDKPELINLVAHWLSEEKNYRWLDFGSGTQGLTAAAVAIMAQRPNQYLRVFTTDDDVTPIGIVGLTNIKRDFKTGTAWIVLGDKQYATKGYALRAGSKLLTNAFTEVGLNSVDVWAVACNYSSLRVINRLNFRPIGIQRQTHIIDGTVYDRHWFDLLAPEHKELEHA